MGSVLCVAKRASSSATDHFSALKIWMFENKFVSLPSQNINIVMNGDNSERLPQEGECRNEEEYGILERASAFSQRVLEEIETLAGTTACKSVQLLRLKKWAQEQGYWFEDRSQFGDFFDRG